MFKSRRNSISSDEGFVVKILSARGGLAYLEGERSIEIESEFTVGSKGVLLYGDSIARWRGPSGEEQVSGEDRQRIIRNISDAFQFDGYTTTIV
jgi:hypothetical protein